jgi:hypothetical protein
MYFFRSNFKPILGENQLKAHTSAKRVLISHDNFSNIIKTLPLQSVRVNGVS